MHDGVLYVSTAWRWSRRSTRAPARSSGRTIPKVPRETLRVACCDAVNRGVALYGDKVYVATLDGYLVALNQSDGKVAWRKEVVPDHDSYTITGAPRVAKGKVLIGSGGAEYRARGFIAAFDWATGDELWRFHTVPGNPADGSRTPPWNAPPTAGAANGGSSAAAAPCGIRSLTIRRPTWSVRNRQCRALESRRERAPPGR
jgi:alcohol dehydrogenase (cytochrome c)/quinohemoprotein ethanol dehydrogenase